MPFLVEMFGGAWDREALRKIAAESKNDLDVAVSAVLAEGLEREAAARTPVCKEGLGEGGVRTCGVGDDVWAFYLPDDAENDAQVVEVLEDSMRIIWRKVSGDFEDREQLVLREQVRALSVACERCHASVSSTKWEEFKNTTCVHCNLYLCRKCGKCYDSLAPRDKHQGTCRRRRMTDLYRASGDISGRKKKRRKNSQTPPRSRVVLEEEEPPSEGEIPMEEVPPPEEDEESEELSIGGDAELPIGETVVGAASPLPIGESVEEAVVGAAVDVRRWEDWMKPHIEWKELFREAENREAHRRKMIETARSPVRIVVEDLKEDDPRRRRPLAYDGGLTERHISDGIPVLAPGASADVADSKGKVILRVRAIVPGSPVDKAAAAFLFPFLAWVKVTTPAERNHCGTYYMHGSTKCVKKRHGGLTRKTTPAKKNKSSTVTSTTSPSPFRCISSIFSSTPYESSTSIRHYVDGPTENAMRSSGL